MKMRIVILLRSMQNDSEYQPVDWLVFESFNTLVFVGVMRRLVARV
jgi:hypothetical protein